MNSTLPRLILAVLSCAALSAAEKAPAALSAAEKAPVNLANELAESVKAARAAMPVGPTTFSIDFPGGSIRDFLTTVGKINGISFAIISRDPKLQLNESGPTLPAFSIRNTNAATVMGVLMRLLSSDGYDLSPASMEMNSVVAVLSRHEAPKPRVPPPSEFESFQLAPYLADQTIEDIVAAIRSAWELDPNRDPNALRLKFHPATSILLVSGPRDGLNMSSKIISQLKQSTKTNPKSAQKSSPPEPDKR